MTERNVLDGALRAVQRAIDGRPIPSDNRDKIEILKTLRDAARKHLDTLPETKTEWRVSYYEDGETRTWNRWSSEDEALESGAHAMRCGKSGVSINSYQVPS